MTFGELTVGAKFKFAATGEDCTKSSSKRYKDAAGTTQLCQAKNRPVLVDGQTAVVTPLPTKLTPEVVTDLWSARVVRWRCPSCLRWVTHPMGKRCLDCRGAHVPAVWTEEN